ncbi:polyphosphate kinase 1 [Almyronema epifaneia]|uniref:Polyphosphate kinase n=1 Tax=Almyronema epifaneia S1 TaxID=2991925 RepID=A0ABW6IK22_9CYAN
MTVAQSSPEKTRLDDPQYYFSRELSWLEFNFRVLHEAVDERTPLLERLKFMAIFSTNLDEFFMVRVAGIKQQIDAGVTKQTPDGRIPQKHLQDISDRLRPMVEIQHSHFEQELRSLMVKNGIQLLNYADLKSEQTAYLDDYFEEQIFPVLTPLAVDPGHPFPYISNLSLNLAVVIQEPETGKEHFARVKVPKVLPRFVVLPDSLRTTKNSKSILWTGVPLEQVIAHNLAALFPGMTVQNCYTFRITRNADLDVEEDEADDLLLAIEQELRKRRLGGSAVRIEIEKSMPEAVRTNLMRQLELTDADLYEVEGLINLGDLMTFMSLPAPQFKDKPWTPVVPKHLQHISNPDDDDDLDAEEAEDFFTIIQQRDQIFHHPYHSFASTVQRFITYAAHDPDVLAIKMTLYRTSGDSPIVQALISAAENGKQVAVLVELKARFDEENNINWARKLEKSGVHVVYGLVGLKTHTKTALVVRHEGDRIRRYVHIGTGNYNPKTARLYTDLGLLSCRDDLGADLTDLFNYLTGYSQQSSFRKLLIAPVSLRQRMLELIRQETEHCRNGRKGKIVAKMNALVDPPIIEALYEASQAGVEIDLIVRGICCLRPGLKGISDHIRVISIIGRFLEHSRIFYFHNDGDEQMFIGSADWMPRNLNRRVEAVVPIEDAKIFQDLQALLTLMLSDNRQAWDLEADGKYIQRRPAKGESERSTHVMLMAQALKSAGME